MSKGMWARVDWEDLSFEHGFKDAQEMLYDFYQLRKMTQEEIGLKLDVSGKVVGLKMREYSIPVRKPGSRPGEKRSPRLPKRGV